MIQLDTIMSFWIKFILLKPILLPSLEKNTNFTGILIRISVFKIYIWVWLMGFELLKNCNLYKTTYNQNVFDLIQRNAIPKSNLWETGGFSSFPSSRISSAFLRRFRNFRSKGKRGKSFKWYKEGPGKSNKQSADIVSEGFNPHLC